MNFDRIGNLLKKYETFQPVETIIRDRLLVLVRAKTGVIIDRSVIQVSNSIVYVKILPVIKAELCRFEAELISDINKSLKDEYKITAIR